MSGIDFELKKTKVIQKNLCQIKAVIFELLDSDEFTTLSKHHEANRFNEYIALLYLCHENLDQIKAHEQITDSKIEFYEKIYQTLCKSLIFILNEIKNEPLSLKKKIYPVFLGTLNSIQDNMRHIKIVLKKDQ